MVWNWIGTTKAPNDGKILFQKINRFFFILFHSDNKSYLNKIQFFFFILFSCHWNVEWTVPVNTNRIERVLFSNFAPDLLYNSFFFLFHPIWIANNKYQRIWNVSTGFLFFFISKFWIWNRLKLNDIWSILYSYHRLHFWNLLFTIKKNS